MAIVPLARATIIGQAGLKTKTLEDLRDKGFLHIITRPAGSADRAGQHGSTALDAYYYLKNCPEKRRQNLDESHFRQNEVEEQALRIKERVIILEQERDYLKERIKNLEPWGDFQFPPIAGLAGHRFWFYVMPLYRLSELEESGHIWECVHKDNRNGYIVVISQAEPQNMPAPRAHTGGRPLAAVRERLDRVETELEDLHWQRIGLTRWLTLFARHLASAEDRETLARLLDDLYEDPDLFYFEAWLPAPRVEELRAYTEQHGLVLAARPPRHDEIPPTLLENPPGWRGGENLVQFYTIPAYDMWDPSRVIFLSFVMFFAMIVSDAGYGLLLGLAWLAGRKKISCNSEGLCRLLGVLVTATIAYGVMAGGYFGVAPEAGSLLAGMQIFDLNNKEQMMFISICIGALHLVAANLGNFIFARRREFHAQPLGWVLIIIGGFCWWLGAVSRPESDLLVAAGKIISISGALCVLLLSGGGGGVEGWRRLPARLLNGFAALAGISKVFGDVLSYLRLFALGLAGAQMAATFNQLAREAMTNIAGLGTLAAVCILLVGHGLNLLLAVMSGVVHGLRLNYIEFFNWGLAREGYLFKPLRKRRIGIWNQL